MTKQSRAPKSLFEIYVKPFAKPRSIKETLERVREILTDKKHWMKHELYYGFGFGPKAALQCCLFGAFNIVGGRFKTNAMNALQKQNRSEFRNWSITTFNDSPGTIHAKVLLVLDKAIAGRR